MKPISSYSVCTLAFYVSLIVGCGGGAADRPPLTPVSGTIMYNGNPIGGATVSFWAEKAPRPATGVTDASGKFKLSMFEPNDGAMAGENVITVTKNEAPAAPNNNDMTAMLNDPAKRASMMAKENSKKNEKPKKPEVPAKYSERGTSPLKETVNNSGTNDFLLQLSGE